MSWGPALDGLEPVPGGIGAVPGFRSAGIAAGLKPSGRPDLALVVSDRPATAACTTTTNRFRAAPCVVTERHAADGTARAVIINAGHANACTGPAGLRDAETTAAEVAARLGCAPSDVLVCSTGVIGERIPMDRLIGALDRLVAALGPDGADDAAAAITTTDTHPKQAAYRLAGGATVGGMAKGAGMIEPDMATMLAVLVTDAALDAATSRAVLRAAVDRTFNRISVDACGSTNDTVVLLANGTAAADPALVARAVEAVCADLAHQIVADGEGSRRLAVLEVGGAASEADARRVARSVAASVLFRAALAGGDPNWGRILAAVGASGVDIDPAAVRVHIGEVTVFDAGAPVAFDRAAAAAAMSQREVPIRIELGAGTAHTTFLTADLTPEYVRFNAEYTT